MGACKPIENICVGTADIPLTVIEEVVCAPKAERLSERAVVHPRASRAASSNPICRSACQATSSQPGLLGCGSLSRFFAPPPVRTSTAKFNANASLMPSLSSLKRKRMTISEQAKLLRAKVGSALGFVCDVDASPHLQQACILGARALTHIWAVVVLGHCRLPRARQSPRPSPRPSLLPGMLRMPPLRKQCHPLMERRRNL